MKKIILITLPLFLLLINLQDFLKKENHDATKVVDNLKGNYAVTESCCLGLDTYPMTIEKSDTNKNRIQLKGLFFKGIRLEATVSGNKIIIAPQIINGVIYSGEGLFTEKQLSINFKLVDLVLEMSDQCVAVCSQDLKK